MKDAVTKSDLMQTIDRDLLYIRSCFTGIWTPNLDGVVRRIRQHVEALAGAEKHPSPPPKICECGSKRFRFTAVNVYEGSTKTITEGVRDKKVFWCDRLFKEEVVSCECLLCGKDYPKGFAWDIEEGI